MVLITGYIVEIIVCFSGKISKLPGWAPKDIPLNAKLDDVCLQLFLIFYQLLTD